MEYILIKTQFSKTKFIFLARTANSYPRTARLKLAVKKNSYNKSFLLPE